MFQKILLFLVLFCSKNFTESPYIIRRIQQSDIIQFQKVYQLIASASQNLAILAHEVTDEYTTELVNDVIAHGLGLVVEQDGQLIGWMLKRRYHYETCRHILYSGNISIHPDYQGKGIGTQLISQFLHEVATNYPDILRVEIYALESNPAYRLYKRLGFVEEGIVKNGKLHPNGKLESYYSMVWFNPNFIHPTPKENA